MKKKGSITVYLLLFLSVFLVLVGAVFLSVRHRGAKTMVKTAARQSMFDLFSRYEPELFRKYGLLFIDAGFGDAQFQPGLLLVCVERNAGILWGENSFATNLWGLGNVQAVLHGYTLATDQGGEAFYRQAQAAAEMGLAADALGILRERISTGNRQEQIGEQQGDVKKACDTYQDAVEKAQEGEYKKGGEKEQHAEDKVFSEPVKDNPIETVKKLQKRGLLGLVMPEDRAISDRSVKKNSLVSGRKLTQGMGLAGVAKTHKTTDHLLFVHYLCSHLSSFTAPDEKAALSWQLEYIVGGKNNDKENLKKTVESLMLLREGANLLYLRSDRASMAKVRAMASSIAAALAAPVGEELIAGVLCVCWAYGESLLDVRTLLAGGKVPVTKDASSWRLSLSDLSSLGKTGSKTDGGGDKGLTYTGYLEILLGMKSDRDCLHRGMDMVETGMRAVSGSNFYLDHCLQSAEIEIRTALNGVGTISAKEYRSYEN